MNYRALIENRKSVRAFSDKKVPAAMLAELAGTPEAAVEVAGILDRAAVNGEYVNRTAANGSWIYSVK